MRTSAHDLVVFDKDADAWTRHPWSQVHARAEGIATRILDQPQPSAVGLVGEPTADFVAAIHATWLAGQSVSILPGPVRGADPQQWAQATLTRFAGLGVRTVFSHGAELGLLSGVDGPLTVLDLGAVAHEPSTGFTPVEAAAETPAVLQGTAGSTGNPRTAQLSAAGGAEQRERPAQPFRCRPGGRCRVYLAAALPRHGSDVSAQRHADGGHRCGWRRRRRSPRHRSAGCGGSAKAAPR